MSHFSWENFIAGWGAGICGLLIGYPADTIKVQQQVQNDCNSKRIIVNIIRHDGIPGLFKGMFFPLITTGTLTSIYFGVYANTLAILQRMQNASPGIRTCYESNVNKYWHYNVFIAGAVGGIAQFVIGCPVDSIKTKFQAQKIGSHDYTVSNRVCLRECLLNLYRHGGWRIFYRGGFVMLLRDIPSNGVYVLSYEHMLGMCRSSSGTPLYTVSCQLLAGGLAGSLAFAVTLPFDVVKSRLQADCVKNPEYKGTIDCIIKSYKTNGVNIFFRGFWIPFLISFPVNAVTFVCYEWILKTMMKLKRKE